MSWLDNKFLWNECAGPGLVVPGGLGRGKSEVQWFSVYCAQKEREAGE